MELHFITQEVLNNTPQDYLYVHWLIYAAVAGFAVILISIILDSEGLAVLGIALMGLGGLCTMAIYMNSTGYEGKDHVKHYIERHSDIRNVIFFDCVTRDTCFALSSGNWQGLPEGAKHLVTPYNKHN